MRKIVLVEDDELFALEVRMKLEDCYGEDVEIVHHTAIAPVATTIADFKPDVLLLDIVLKDDVSSMRLAEQLIGSGLAIIFMTAYDNEAFFKMALKVKAKNYLQKPFTATRLKHAIELAISHEKELTNGNQEGSVLLKGKEKVYEKVSFEEIIAIEAFGNYCHIYASDRRFTHRMVLKNFYEKFSSDDFVRIHRNFVINIRCVEKINTQDHTVRVAGKDYPYSQKFKKDLFQKFSRI